MNAIANALRSLIASADESGNAPQLWPADVQAARAALAAHDAAVADACHIDDGMIDCPMPENTGEWVAIADGPHMHDDEGVIAWAHPARAARIVACVNACEGIADPAGLVRALRDCVAALDSVAAPGSLQAAARDAGAAVLGGDA